MLSNAHLKENSATDNQLQNLEGIDPQMYQSPTCTSAKVPMPMLQLITKRPID